MIRLFATICLLTAGFSPAASLADRYNSDFSFAIVNTTQDFSFNIASDLSGTATPNVLSELIWENVEAWALQGNVNIGLGKSFRLGMRIEVGAIVDGDVSDKDYLGDNRTDLVSYAVARVDGKHHISGDFKIGWELRNSFEVPIVPVGESGKSVAFASSISVTPQIGYSYAKQEFLFKDGVQLVPDLGPFDGLYSTYKPEWQGPYLGADGSFRIAGPIHLLVSGRYYPALRMRGDGHWNLREDLEHPLSFRDSADGDGFTYEVGLRWTISDKTSLDLSYGEVHFETDPGTAQVFSVDFGDLYTRLNKAEWESERLQLGFRWLFGH